MKKPRDKPTTTATKRKTQNAFWASGTRSGHFSPQTLLEQLKKERKEMRQILEAEHWEKAPMFLKHQAYMYIVEIDERIHELIEEIENDGKN